MVQLIPQVDRFKQQLRAVLQQKAAYCRVIKLAKHANVYTCGEQAATVYFVESGQIKLLMLAPDGKECLLAILTAGDIFGESCLTNMVERPETATAMTKSVVRAIPRAHFLACLHEATLQEGFVHYLALRIAEQRSIIADFVTVDSEQRLGKRLLHLARKLGKHDPHTPHTPSIEPRITHEELAAMVGTTRPRISQFMQRFRALGLIEISTERFLIVQAQKLDEYLTQLN